MGWGFIWCCGVLLGVLWFGNCWWLVGFVGLAFGFTTACLWFVLRFGLGGCIGFGLLVWRCLFYCFNCCGLPAVGLCFRSFVGASAGAGVCCFEFELLLAVCLGLVICVFGVCACGFGCCAVGWLTVSWWFVFGACGVC